jgi:hypothetical protein
MAQCPDTATLNRLQSSRDLFGETVRRESRCPPASGTPARNWFAPTAFSDQRAKREIDRLQ